ncbi:hypothetical protein THAOC_26049, partial [Thalassiosira oceanica]
QSVVSTTTGKDTIGTSDIGTLKLGDDNDSRTVQQVYHASDPIPTANMSADLRDRASADVGSEPSEGNHKSALKPEDRHHVTKLMRSDAELGYAIQAKRQPDSNRRRLKQGRRQPKDSS